MFLRNFVGSHYIFSDAESVDECRAAASVELKTKPDTRNLLSHCSLFPDYFSTASFSRYCRAIATLKRSSGEIR